MARQPNVQRPISLHTTIPEDLWTKLTLHLYSDVEGRVPKGAYQQFIIQRINEFFQRREDANP